MAREHKLATWNVTTISWGSMCRQGGERIQLGHHDNLECENYHGASSVCEWGGEGTQFGHYDHLHGI